MAYKVALLVAAIWCCHLWITADTEASCEEGGCREGGVLDGKTENNACTGETPSDLYKQSLSSDNDACCPTDTGLQHCCKMRGDRDKKCKFIIHYKDALQWIHLGTCVTPNATCRESPKESKCSQQTRTVSLLASYEDPNDGNNWSKRVHFDIFRIPSHCACRQTDS